MKFFNSAIYFFCVCTTYVSAVVACHCCKPALFHSDNAMQSRTADKICSFFKTICEELKKFINFFTFLLVFLSKHFCHCTRQCAILGLTRLTVVVSPPFYHLGHASACRIYSEVVVGWCTVDGNTLELLHLVAVTY